MCVCDGRADKRVQAKNLKEGDQLEDLGVNKRILLKRILERGRELQRGLNCLEVDFMTTVVNGTGKALFNEAVKVSHYKASGRIIKENEMELYGRKLQWNDLRRHGISRN
jgi:hypothetical protein